MLRTVPSNYSVKRTAFRGRLLQALATLGRRLLKPEVGDVFAIPLPDGDQAIGQVVARVDDLGSVGCALFSFKHQPNAPLPKLVQPISVLLVTPELLQRRVWPVVEQRSVKVASKYFGWEAFRRALWVGAKIHGAGIVREFMEAYHGFGPWDAMADPNYFSNLLVKGSTMPPSAYVSGG